MESTGSEKASSFSSELPQYPSAAGAQTRGSMEKQRWVADGPESPPSPLNSHSSRSPCYRHGVSQTPYLDAHLSQPDTRAHLQTLSEAIVNAGKDGCCTKCVIESSAMAVTAHIRDVKAARKNGQWSHTEKKALKAEVKSLYKGMKHDIKKVWKAKPEA